MAPSPRQHKRDARDARIKEAFEAGKQRDGARRIQKELLKMVSG